MQPPSKETKVANEKTVKIRIKRPVMIGEEMHLPGKEILVSEAIAEDLCKSIRGHHKGSGPCGNDEVHNLQRAELVK